jgi:hypothetical protein
MKSAMKEFYLLGFSLWFLPHVCAIADPLNHIPQKRNNGGDLDCNFPAVSALCVSLNTVNAQGLNVLEALYFAMLNSSLPDSTIYSSDENIICVTHTSGPTIQVTAGIGVGEGAASAGVSVTTNITIAGTDIGGKI